MSSTTTPVASTRTAQTSVATSQPSALAYKLMAVLRIAYGFVFLWAFFDKLFGLGFATAADKAWIRGGDPTFGYLTNSPKGPFEGFYHSLAGDWWVTPLFMIALLGVGAALVLGVGMRIAAIAGTLLYVMMWSVALLPTTNPFLDDHLLGALTLIVLAAFAAGDTWGLGRRWRDVPLVAKHQILR